jgi:hypothetical protein
MGAVWDHWFYLRAVDQVQMDVFFIDWEKSRASCGSGGTPRYVRSTYPGGAMAHLTLLAGPEALSRPATAPKFPGGAPAGHGCAPTWTRAAQAARAPSGRSSPAHPSPSPKRATSCGYASLGDPPPPPIRILLTEKTQTSEAQT